MDEYKKAMARVELGMRTIQVVIGERRLSVGIDSEAERFANDLAASWNSRAEAKVSGEVVGLLTEIAMLADDDAGWTDGDIKSFGMRADAILGRVPAPQSPNILASLPPGKWIVTVTDEQNGSVERFEGSTVDHGSVVGTSLPTADISDLDIIRAFTAEATKKPTYDFLPKYTEEQVALGLLSVRKYFESRQTTTPPLSGNSLPSRFELYEMFRGRAITNHAANSIAVDVIHLLANAREIREDRYREAIEEMVGFAELSEDVRDIVRLHELLGSVIYTGRKALATVGKEG